MSALTLLTLALQLSAATPETSPPPAAEDGPLLNNIGLSVEAGALLEVGPGSSGQNELSPGALTRVTWTLPVWNGATLLVDANGSVNGRRRATGLVSSFSGTMGAALQGSFGWDLELWSKVHVLPYVGLGGATELYVGQLSAGGHHSLKLINGLRGFGSAGLRVTVFDLLLRTQLDVGANHFLRPSTHVSLTAGWVF